MTRKEMDRWTEKMNDAHDELATVKEDFREIDGKVLYVGTDTAIDLTGRL